MPRNFDQMSKPPKPGGQNPYALEVSQTQRPDGGGQFNINAPTGSMQLNRDPTGNMTVTQKKKLTMEDIMPFVSLQPAAAAMDQIYGTKMAGAMPSQGQLISQYQRLNPEEDPMAQINMELARTRLAKMQEPEKLSLETIERLKRQDRGLDLSDKRARMAEEKEQTRQEELAQKKLDSKRLKYSEKVAKLNVPRFEGLLKEVSRVLTNYDDIPGQGEGRLAPKWWYELKGDQESSDALALRRATDELFNVELAARSGAAVTAQELQRLQNERAAGKLNSDASVRRAMDRIREALKKDLKNAEVGLGGEEVLQAYLEKGGDDFISNLESFEFNKRNQKTSQSKRLEELRKKQAGG